MRVGRVTPYLCGSRSPAAPEYVECVASQTELAKPLVSQPRSTRSSIALKLLMAGSGLIFIAFVLLHMYGNLKAFAGHDAFNDYAHHLRTFGEPMLPYGGLLWVVRAVLIVSPLDSIAVLTLVAGCWLIAIGIVDVITAIQVRGRAKHLTESPGHPA